MHLFLRCLVVGLADNPKTHSPLQTEESSSESFSAEDESVSRIILRSRGYFGFRAEFTATLTTFRRKRVFIVEILPLQCNRRVRFRRGASVDFMRRFLLKSCDELIQCLGFMGSRSDA
ncbi:hypothetical protein TNCT_671921 [Trichonephila clavata]|uniref:Uncharacterized protein n=1 Tax=Trichonephila clavata TaxID=2740835 RepID=A0A8X6LA27_TRICU|nr:hypothetical protein TNCT_511 [Trichonephila clavata]GFR00877.1 hypothetical protein TNCT_671921 [Trichonephila clavata]